MLLLLLLLLLPILLLLLVLLQLLLLLLVLLLLPRCSLVTAVANGVAAAAAAFATSVAAPCTCQLSAATLRHWHLTCVPGNHMLFMCMLYLHMLEWLLAEKRGAAVADNKDERAPAAASAAAAAAAEAAGPSSGAAELPIQLSDLRRADVSEFRGSVYVNIREYYEVNIQHADLFILCAICNPRVMVTWMQAMQSTHITYADLTIYCALTTHDMSACHLIIRYVVCGECTIYHQISVCCLC